MNNCTHCQKATKNSKFCSSSCAAIFNNKIYHKGLRKGRLCKVCGTTDTNRFAPNTASLCKICNSRNRKHNRSDKTLFRDKIYDFNKDKRNGIDIITEQQVLDKFGEKTTCYLTGKEINIREPRTYHFDHIIPTSKGGKNTIENLGICSRAANFAKSDMTQEELIDFCKSVLTYNGFEVNKAER